jgi:hypothetical protein
MIQLNHGYTIFFTVELAGVATAADSTPTAVLYRNGSASGVTVTVSTTAVTGLYVATFTTDSEWAKTDVLHLTVAATIDSTSGYVAVVWDSTGDVDAVMRGTDSANTTTPPTASAVADEVQTRTIARVTLVDTCTANSDMRGTDGAYTGTPPSVVEIQSGLATAAALAVVDGVVDAVLIDTGTTLPAQIAAIDAGSGSGARTITITVTDGTDPLQNAKVRLTEGANTFTALTNVSGVATLNVDDATYTVAITKASYSFAGASLVVDGDETQTYAMTLVSVSPPADADLCSVTIPVIDQYGAALAGEDVEIRFNAFADNATATAVVLSPPPVQVSDENGLVSVNLLRLASYSVFYGEGTYKRRLDFSVPDAGSFTVSE